MSKVSFHNLTQNADLGDAISVADSSRTRSVGLLKHKCLNAGEGLWIIPSEGIHTFWMQFAIDVIFMDKKKRVTKVVPRMKPWRMALSLRAHSVLELPPGTAERTGLQKGDQLEMRKQT